MRSTPELMQDLLTCDSPDRLHEIGSACARRIGFDAWVYAAMPGGDQEIPYLFGSLPAAWYADHFKNGHGAADPVFAHCRRRTTALYWTDGDDTDKDEEARCPVFFREEGGTGFRHGVSVPVHGLGCLWGVVAVAACTPARAPTRARALGDVYMFAAHVHEVGHRLAAAAATGAHIHLTCRERECLRWTAEGKTGWEISRVLGISERTVVFHLENAARKFGVFGRRQAVARAIALQIISI